MATDAPPQLPTALWRQSPPTYKITPPTRIVTPTTQSTLITQCRAAAAGERDAYYQLGWLYFRGQGIIVRDPARAAGWLQRAAQAGDLQAKNLLALLTNVPPQSDPTCERLLQPPPLPTVPSITPSPQVAQIETWVRELAPHFNLHPDLVMAVIAIESGFNAHAQSPAGAQGLMQLMPATAARFGVKNVWDAKSNLLGGMTYLSWLLRRFHGDIKLALAGYNAGEGAVDQYNGIPPYTETRNYVERITRKLQHSAPASP